MQGSEIILELQKVPEFKILQQKLADYADNFRIVGGAIRNILGKQEITDIDFAANLNPTELVNLFNKLNIKNIPTGIEHGTITIVIDKKNFEITSLREDVETFGRHAKVTFSKDWEQDAKRRDFTINAIYLDFSGKIYDYHSGQKDLANNLLKFIGDAQQRIIEDYLRILRLFRFAAYLPNAQIEPDSLKAAIKLKSHLHNLSIERVQTELWKLLAAPNFLEIVNLLAKHKILSGFFEISETALAHLNKNKDIFQKIHFSVIHKLAWLLRDDLKTSKELMQFAKDFKISNREKALLNDLLFNSQEVELSSNDKTHKALLRKFGKEIYQNILLFKLLQHPDESARFEELNKLAKDFIIPEFPISGHDLIKIGYRPGIELRKILAKLETKWEASDYLLNRDDLLKNILANKGCK
jgi:poly(A) polymerase